MPTAHCVSTTDGIILAADQGFLDLVRRPETHVVGHSYRDLTDPRDVAKSADMIATLIDRAAPILLHKRYSRPDGTMIAATLLVTRFSEPDRLVTTLFWSDPESELHPTRLRDAALRVRSFHSARNAEFGRDLNTDPIGCLLISIYLAEAEGRSIDSRQLATEADIPLTVTLRWITVLRERGLVQHSAPGAAGVQFTAKGIAKMERSLTGAYRMP